MSMSLQCICSVPAWYTTPCPQCEIKQGSLDPQPSKCVHKSAPKQLGVTQGLEARIGLAKGKETAQDDKVVSLYTEDEEEMQMETGDSPMTRGDFAHGEVNMDLKIADAARIMDLYYWQVPSNSLEEMATNVQTELVDTLAVCRNNNNFVCCSHWG